MATIEELRAALMTARAAEQVARERYERALVEGFKFKVGDVIRSAKGMRAKIIDVRVEYAGFAGEYVRMTALAQKPDGEWSKRKAPLWLPHWADPELVGREGG